MGKKEFEKIYAEIDNGIVTIGFKESDANKDFLENIVFFEFKVNQGDKVTKGKEIIGVESLKGTDSLNTEVSGEVIEINNSVSENPDLLKDSPTIWLIKIKLN